MIKAGAITLIVSAVIAVVLFTVTRSQSRAAIGFGVIFMVTLAGVIVGLTLLAVGALSVMTTDAGQFT